MKNANTDKSLLRRLMVIISFLALVVHFQQFGSTFPFLPDQTIIINNHISPFFQRYHVVWDIYIVKRNQRENNRFSTFSQSYIDLDHYETILNAYTVVANVLTYASFFSIVALSADRFLVIRLQLRYQDAVTHKRAIAGVISFWLLSTVLPLIRFLEWLSENIFFILTVTIQFINLITAGLFYFKIFLALRQRAAQAQDVPVESGERNEAINATRERKVAYGVFYVYLALMACYLPIICFNIAENVIGPVRTSLTYKVNLYVTILLALNSSLSPLIYCWKMGRIRQAMINILRKPFQN